MKRKRFVIAVLVSVIMIFCLSGCESSARVSIEDYQWEVTTIQDNDSGYVAACSDGYTDLFPDAAEIDISCTAGNGELTLTNRTDNQTYSGTYVKESSEPESIIYRISICEEDGTAVCAWTVYSDGSTTPTLIFSVGGYTLNFEGA